MSARETPIVRGGGGWSSPRYCQATPVSSMRGARSVAILLTALLLLLALAPGAAADGLTPPVITVASPRCAGADPTILLQWQGVPGAAGYAVFSGDTLVYSADGNTLSWTATGLTPGQPYSFQVQAVSDLGSSDRSAAALATAPTCKTTGTLLAAPTLLAADAQCYGADSAVQLRWSAVSGATGYRLWRSGDLVATVGAGTTSFWNIKGLVAGQTYSFQVQAQSGSTVSPLSGALIAVAPSGCGGGVESPVTLTLNNHPLYTDVAPRIESGRTLVPLRAIAEGLGVQVNWDEASRTVTLNSGLTTVKVRIDDPAAQINGHAVRLDVPARIAAGRTLVPVRFISEAFGALVIWLADSRTVVIQSREFLYQIEVQQNPQAKAPLTAAVAQGCLPRIEGLLAANAEAVAALGSDEAQRIFTAIVCYESGGDPYAIGLNKNRATGLCDAQQCTADLGLGQINVDVNARVPYDRAADDSETKANLRADPALASYFDPQTNLAMAARIYRSKLDTLASWGGAADLCTAIPLYNGNGQAIRVAVAQAGSTAWYGSGAGSGVRYWLQRMADAGADDPGWSTWEAAFARVWPGYSSAAMRQALQVQASTALRYAGKVGYCP